MADLRAFFTQADREEILIAIREAEARTSGEIRVRVEATTDKDPMVTARRVFEALGMRETELHNGVLFLIAVEDRRFVILGDDGIDRKVPADFWDGVRDVVLDHFRQQRFAAGLAAGIRLAGEQLATYFPRQDDDINELPDAISFADDELRG